MPDTCSPDPNCKYCHGSGAMDSGGVTPWGASIEVRCICTHPESPCGCSPFGHEPNCPESGIETSTVTHIQKHFDGDCTCETQQSIALWAEQTFGLSTQLRAATRMNEEVAELLAKMSNATVSHAKIIEEVADVQIVLYVLAGRLHMDLQAEVERKMKVNRERKWVLDGSGCGQHVD